MRRHREKKKQAAETLRETQNETSPGTVSKKLQGNGQIDRQRGDKTRAERETTHTNQRSEILKDLKREDLISPASGLQAANPDSPQPSAGATRIDPNWQPNVDDTAAAVSYGIGESDVAKVRDAFVDHYLARAGEWGLSLDWSAMWRKYCRDAARRMGAKAPNTGAQAKHPDFVFIARDAPEWAPWQEHYLSMKGRKPPTTTKNGIEGWYFPS